MYSLRFYIHLYKWLQSEENHNIIREKQGNEINDEIMHEFTTKKRSWEWLMRQVSEEIEGGSNERKGK